MTERSPGPIVLWLSSRYENLELAQAVLEHVCRHRSIGSDTEHWIGVALREAVANAIKHGNRLDLSKNVHVEMDLVADTLAICIRDEGEGFEPTAVGDPLAPENRLKTSGRGIFYMRTFMDEVRFRRHPDGGMEIVLKKNLGAIEKKEENPA